jgi:alpha-L-fucosidase 2
MVALALGVSSLLAPFASAAPSPSVTIDWPAFLSKQDLLWTKLPTHWEEGAFLGNGLVGAMVFASAERTLSFQLGRTDITDHQKGREPILARPRLPVGRLEIQTAGKLEGAEARLSLRDAEWSGTLRTTRGSLELRSYVHATLPVLVVELAASGEEGARIGFQPAEAINPRLLVRRLPITDVDRNPAPFIEERGATRVSVQPRRAGGEYAVAWQETSLGGARRLIILSIADSFPGADARNQAAAAVARAVEEGPAALRRSHQAYWHAFYPASFVSIPNARLQSFYWIQMYKLASATRADRPAMGTLGPWYHATPIPGINWNLSLQLSYWPVHAANRLSLGESLLGIVDRNQDNLRSNVPASLGNGLMAVGRQGGPDAISPVDLTYPAAKGAHEISNLVWVMHDYWLHWRHAMDPALLQRMYPLLKASVGYVLTQLKPGQDGKLHLPVAISPEFPKTVADTNYDLSLLRWGLQTLIDLHRRAGDKQAPVASWRDTLARLTPYPVGPNGYSIGRDQPLDQSHRHFSHLFMVYPLRLVTGVNVDERTLIEKSLAHWIGLEGALQGQSFVGASAISSLLGKGEDAERFLVELLRRFVKPNTMYLEPADRSRPGSGNEFPVLETPLAAAQAIHEMLLQSWGGTLRIFPAIPAGWKEVAFHELRAEGAFLVSAVRRGGRTVLVKVKSLAGEPANLRADLDDPEIVGSSRRSMAKKQADGTWRLTLAKGESLVLQARGLSSADRTIAPIAATGDQNAFGLR